MRNVGNLRRQVAIHGSKERTMGTGPDKLEVRTHPADPDPELRGRTYAIPFDAVWQAVCRLAAGGLLGWNLLEADDYSGILRVRVRGLFLPRPARVRIRVGLDANGQTTVGLRMRAVRLGSGGAINRRRLKKMLDALDRSLQVNGGKTLDPLESERFPAMLEAW